jgi:hypothetical protein
MNENSKNSGISDYGIAIAQWLRELQNETSATANPQTCNSGLQDDSFAFQNLIEKDISTLFSGMSEAGQTEQDVKEDDRHKGEDLNSTSMTVQIVAAKPEENLTVLPTAIPILVDEISGSSPGIEHIFDSLFYCVETQNRGPPHAHICTFYIGDSMQID